MAEIPELDEMSVRQLRPRAILDGGEDWSILGPTIGRLIDELAGGAVLEVISRESSTRNDIPGWCNEAGHGVFWLPGDAQVTRFWIKKGGKV